MSSSAKKKLVTKKKGWELRWHRNHCGAQCLSPWECREWRCLGTLVLRVSVASCDLEREDGMCEEWSFVQKQYQRCILGRHYPVAWELVLLVHVFGCENDMPNNHAEACSFCEQGAVFMQELLMTGAWLHEEVLSQTIGLWQERPLELACKRDLRSRRNYR